MDHKIKVIGLSKVLKLYLFVICLTLFSFAVYIWNEFWLGSISIIILLFGGVSHFLFAKINLYQSHFDFVIPVGFMKVIIGKVRYDEITEIIINRTTPFYKGNLSDKNITWRERVIFKDIISFHGFYLGNLSDLIDVIEKKNPKVIVSYKINSTKDNLIENKDYYIKRSIFYLFK